MKTAAALVVTFLWFMLAVAPVQAQETQAEPNPNLPVPAQTKDSQPRTTQKTPAPIERRASKPTAGWWGQVAGPLDKTGASQASGQTEQPVNRGGEVETIKVRTRLVNVALNVVDTHGSPGGGFGEEDLQLLEDRKA